MAVPCALIPPQMLPCAGGATGRLCPRDEALKCALKSLEGSKPLESFRRDVPSITGQCQYLPQLLCEDRGGRARLCLPFREKLKSLWDVAAISARLFIFPSVRKPLIYELHMGFNPRLWAGPWRCCHPAQQSCSVLREHKPGSSSPAPCIQAGNDTNYLVGSGHLCRILILSAQFPHPLPQHSGFLGWTEAPWPLLGVKHITELARDFPCWK